MVALRCHQLQTVNFKLLIPLVSFKVKNIHTLNEMVSPKVKRLIERSPSPEWAQQRTKVDTRKVRK